MLTPVELKNLRAFVETGAKAISDNKALQESVDIQFTALTLLQKIEEACTPKPEEPKGD